MNTLETRIKMVLEETGMEPVDFSRASGASISVVSQWLSGAIKSMRLDFALNVEDATGYSHVWLMIGKGERKQVRPLSFADLSGMEAQLLMFYRSLSEEKKHELEAIANRMATELAAIPSVANPYPQRDQFGGKLLTQPAPAANKKKA